MITFERGARPFVRPPQLWRQPMTPSLIVTSISGLVAVSALITLLLDRAARAQAWRRIADERRWNYRNGSRNSPP
jgi:hypothetical protein